MPPSTLGPLWTQPRVASFLPGKVIQLSHHPLPVRVSPYDPEPAGGHATERPMTLDLHRDPLGSSTPASPNVQLQCQLHL